MSASLRLIDFINSSPSPFHVVATSKKILSKYGFTSLSSKNIWNLQKNKCYFVTMNQSALFAFAIGGKYENGNGISIIGAHTDSPCLKIKPKSAKIVNDIKMLGCEVYGGGLWYTWFDRDLTVAGRVFYKDCDNNGAINHKLVHIKKPICRVSSLAIHLNRESGDNFKINKENHLSPILCTNIVSQLEETSCDLSDIENRHHSCLMKLIASEVKCKVNNITEVELYVCDTQPSVIGGIENEFIFAPRLDNQFNCFSAVEALVNTLDTLSDETHIRFICLYDNEECGSGSAQGAESRILESIIRRISNNLSSKVEYDDDSFERTLANSFIISADQGHAVHPNYTDKHEANHRVALHKGILLKINSNQRYSSSGISISILREIAERAKVPLQEVCVRQDSMCGSTIGPILSHKLGVKTVDVGGPMLSMHSCREMCCTTSVEQSIDLFSSFFLHFPEINATFSGD